jgi:NitT/TauT family transport system substrate-binding protein
MPRRTLLAAAVAGLTALAHTAGAAEPVQITYGYHPYWTGGWNGVIIKARELWREHLPEGSEVTFEAHLTGPPMVNALLSGKMQIGTMGDMPSFVATARREIDDVRLVSVPMLSEGQNCNKILVRADAPAFASVAEAMGWLDGKPFAVHRGTCANRFVEAIIEKGAFAPAQVNNVSIEVIASSFEAGRLDAAAMWEPHAARAVTQGHARYVATGAPWDEKDANFTLMRQQFIEAHPEAAAGWIKAEIEAVRFMIERPEETVAILEEALTDYDAETIRRALYVRNDAAIGGAEVNYVGQFTFDAEIRALMEEGYAFLHRIDVLRSGEVPADAINEAPLEAALADLGIEAPVGAIRGE